MGESRSSVDNLVSGIQQAFGRLSNGSQPSPASPTEAEPEGEPGSERVSSASEAEEDHSTLEEVLESTPRAADPPDTRWYAVWLILRTALGHFVGIHASVGNLAYCRILGANLNEFTSIRFRRAETREVAQRLFREEAAVHEVGPDLAYTIFRWS